MNAIWMFALLTVGVALGAALGYLYARSRLAGATADLAAQASGAQARARAAEEKAALIDGQLAARFQSLSAQALDASQRRFLELAEGSLRAANLRAAGELDSRRTAVEHLVAPLKDTLARVEEQLRETDKARLTSQAALAEQVSLATRTSEELRIQTRALVTALHRPEARGRWGEMQLRRVVEIAGMSPRCDFDEQVSTTTDDGRQRPDMVIRLAGGKNIVVDSKVSLAAYLDAAEATDEDVRTNRLGAHARHLRKHVDSLAAKAYWNALQPAPEFVVLFIPGEAFLAPALERDPGLLEHAMAHKVHIATPTTLITMLRTAQYAWQNETLSENARQISQLGRLLYDRLRVFGEHADGVGKSLAGAVSAYNKAISSLESRVLVTARQLNDLGITDSELQTPRTVEEAVRPLSADDLLAPSAPPLLAADGEWRLDGERRSRRDETWPASPTALPGGRPSIEAAG